MKLYLLLALCGLTAASEYIVGGDDVTEAGKWPWQGSMRYKGSHVCGITLISSTKGLTAAHCLEEVYPGDVTFMFGSNNRLNNSVVVKALKITLHEEWDQGEGIWPNDIAIVEFDKAISGANIATAHLTEKGKDHAGNSDCWITGWGSKVKDGDFPKTLQEANVDVYPNAVCKLLVGESANDGNTCIGDTVNKRTSCIGDSGSPLVCKVNDQYELVGIGSWGSFTCFTFVPAGYTGIAYFRDWIKTNAGI